jgi:Flp pilus assembly protein TadG
VRNEGVGRGNRANRRRGSTALEFVLVGIPMLFILFSLFEAARGMWTYQMLAYAIREGTRYASVHGKGCASPNTCQVTIGQLVTYIRTAGPLIDASSTVTFTPATGSVTSGTVTALSTNTAIWPPSTANTAGQTVQISIVYPFRTILAMFWAGAGQPLNDSQTFNLGASSAEPIQF